jgi:hypothetical protein
VRLLRRTTTTLALALVTATAFSATASPAQADSSAKTKYYGPYSEAGAGSAKFVAYGEHLKITDNDADGYSVVVRNKRQDLCCTWYEGWNHNGEGTTVDYDLNMPEGNWIQYEVCEGVFPTKLIIEKTCSDIVTDYA